MAKKIKCHICKKKSSTDPCEFCGAILTQPAPESPVLFTGGYLIEGKLKQLQGTFILTNQRLICTDVKAVDYVSGQFGIVGAAIGAAVQEASKSKYADKCFSVPLSSIAVVKKHTKGMTRGYTIVTHDGYSWRVSFGKRKKWEAALAQFIQETDEK